MTSKRHSPAHKQPADLWTARKIKSLRKRLGLRREELACELGVSMRTIFRWEKGASEPRLLAARALTALAEKGI